MELSVSLEKKKSEFESFFSERIEKLYPSKLSSLHGACRYALEGEGKRVRPLLAISCFLSCGGKNLHGLLEVATAIEMIHTYSLVHDDLPCMDDDDTRRGRATTHKLYGEATALLVGDSLLSDAFALISQPFEGFEAGRQLRLIREFSSAIGGEGMVLGQSLDMYWTDRDNYKQSDLDEIHRLKTGKLIMLSCVAGALLAGADENTLAGVRELGEKLGLAFQIHDDLLDVSTQTGKSQGKDLAQNKLTYLRMMSPQEAKSRVESLSNQARSIANELSSASSLLSELIDALLKRVQ